MTEADVYDATVPYAWRLALCLHPDADAAARAVERAYRTLFAGPEATGAAAADLHGLRTRLLAVLTEQARPLAAAG